MLIYIYPLYGMALVIPKSPLAAAAVALAAAWRRGQPSPAVVGWGWWRGIALGSGRWWRGIALGQWASFRGKADVVGVGPVNDVYCCFERGTAWQVWPRLWICWGQL